MHNTTNEFSMVTRRRVSVLFLATTAGLSGCNADSSNETTETTERDDSQTPVDRDTETAPTVRSEEATSTQTADGGLNDTNYAVAWPFAPDGVVGRSYGSPLGDVGTAATLLTSPAEATEFLAAVESATDTSPSEIQLVTATDFSTASVVVVQRSVSSGASRLRLESVDAVGTTAPQLAVREVGAGPTQAAPTRLLLVRLPNGGESPETATVRVTGGDGTTTTVTADPYA